MVHGACVDSKHPPPRRRGFRSGCDFFQVLKVPSFLNRNRCPSSRGVSTPLPMLDTSTSSTFLPPSKDLCPQGHTPSSQGTTCTLALHSIQDSIPPFVTVCWPFVWCTRSLWRLMASISTYALFSTNFVDKTAISCSLVQAPATMSACWCIQHATTKYPRNPPPSSTVLPSLFDTCTPTNHRDAAPTFAPGPSLLPGACTILPLRSVSSPVAT